LLIGFAPDDPAGNGSSSDAELLHQFGCERILSAAHGVPITEDVIEYLRPGDTLVVGDLSRLEASLASLIHLVVRLDKAGVTLQVANGEIAPATALGGAFAKVCGILAAFILTQAQQASAGETQQQRSRGRPVALSPEAQRRAARMLKNGRASVNEIAQILKVSPATVYRYFPRGGRGSNLLAPERSGPQRVQFARASKDEQLET
jgi:DNA invertase Pin-like site-specific DNA recombinase